MQQEQTQQQQQAAEKKEYTAPKLTPLGEIAELTQTFIGNSGPISFWSN